MSATSLALGRERSRERDISWEPKSFSVAWGAEPFYDTGIILEKQSARSATSPTLDDRDNAETISDPPEYPAWLIWGFTVGVILFLIGVIGVGVSVLVRRALFTDSAIAVMAVGMIVLAFAILKEREITDIST